MWCPLSVRDILRDVADVVSTLASFIPAVAVRHCVDNPDPLQAPIANRSDAAVLFLDISGFTPLAESLTKLGAEGSERLTSLLNAYFGRLIEIVGSHGGEVVSFAGDAFIAVWQKGRAGDTPEEVLHRIVSCSMEMQAAQPELKEELDVDLGFKLGVGLGAFELLHVGGQHEQWALLNRGSSIERAISAEGFASPGDIIVSPQAWKYLADGCRGTTVGGKGFVRLQNVSDPVASEPIEQVVLPAEIEDMLGAYVMPVVQSRLGAGQHGWLGELRRLTVIFANLPQIKADTKLSRVHSIVGELQSCIFQYEGMINKLSVDEKGVSVLAAFGLPPLSHEQDAERAVRAALKMRQKLEDMSLNCSIGVTTGKAFCGAVGSPHRREYTVIGDVVNLAARLMQAAKGGLLCDKATRSECTGTVRFKNLDPIKVKGKKKPIAVCKPILSKKKKSAKGKTDKTPDVATMVGRESEQKTLNEAIGKLFESQEGCVVAVHGEPGLGKSLLMECVEARAHELTLEVAQSEPDSKELKWASSEGHAMETRTPFLAWHKILWRLLGPADGDRNKFRDLLTPILKRAGVDPLSFPLLNDVLGLKVAETKLTRRMDALTRTQKVCEIVTTLLAHEYGDEGLLILIDDCQWLDPASWELLAAVIEKVEHLVAVISMRERPPDLSDAGQDVLQHAVDICLDPLGQGEIKSLVCVQTGADDVDSAVLGTIFERSGGNPFFATELTRILVDAEHVEVNEGVCRLVDPGLDIKSLNFPTTMEGLITSRIDSLPAREQLTLKVASVVGSVFEMEMIKFIYPLKEERRHVKASLRSLTNKGFLTVESARVPLLYKFRQTTLQEAAYDLMLFEQRRKIHATTADWYEKHKEEQYVNALPLIAYHWEASGNIGKALQYLDEATQEASDAAVHTDVIRLVSQALACAERAGEDEQSELHRARFCRWYRLMADANFSLGRIDQSVQDARESIKHIGITLPTTAAGWNTWRPLAWLQQNTKRLLSGLVSRTSGAIYVDGSLAATRLCKCAFLLHDPALVGGANQLAVLLAQRADNDARVAPVYTFAGTMMAAQNQHKKAVSHFKKAHSLAAKHRDYTALIAVAEAVAAHGMGTAKWQTAQQAIDRAKDLVTTHGDRAERDRVLNTLGHLLYFRGRFQRSSDQFTQLMKLASRHKSSAFQTHALSGQARVHLVQGNHADAEQALVRALKLLEAAPNYSLEILCRGLIGLSRLHQGKFEQAREDTKVALGLIRNGSLLSFLAVTGYIGTAEAFVQMLLLATHDQMPGKKEIEAATEEALQALNEFASQWIIGAPAAARLKGYRALVHKDNKEAKRSFEESIEYATRLKMTFEEATALLDLGRCRGVGVSEQRHCLMKASKLFNELRCHTRAMAADKAVESLRG